MPRTFRDSEAAEQALGTALLRSAGFAVYELSQGYRSDPGGTRQTPGLPDVYAMHPSAGSLWWEAKAHGGQLRPSQEAFADNATYCGVPVLQGTAEAVRTYLRAIGVLRPWGHDGQEAIYTGWAGVRWPQGLPRFARDDRTKPRKAAR